MGKTQGEGGAVEESPEQLKARLAELEAAKVKAETDRDNYRQGMLTREEELKKLKEANDDTVNDDNTEVEWDDNSRRFQQETLSKTEKVAAEAALKALEQRYDKTAQQEFRESHPEIDDAKWEEIVANYNPKSGKDSVKGIIKDLERAYVVYKFDAGETIDPAEIARTQAENRNKDLNVTHGASSGSGKAEEEKGGVSDGAKELAKRFGISEEKLAQEDDSRQATISMTKR